MNLEIIALLKKYVDNRCTPGELDQVRSILLSGDYQPEWDAVLEDEAVKDMTDESEISSFDSQGVLDRINSTIRPVRTMRRYNWMAGVAASLLILFCVGMFLRKNHQSANEPLLSIATDAGQQKTITLTDGTQIVLNSKSTLRYTAEFTGAKREVFLSGEAFFNVMHDAKHPFIVHTDRLNVQVLGTSFNVRSYKSDLNSTVSVATGKVGVNGTRPSHTYMLLPGNRLSYSVKNEFKQDDVSIDDVMGWQKGILVFHLETIDEIAPVLERYYGVTIKLDHVRQPERQVTVSFNQKTLPQVLEILAQTAGFRYAIDKNQIIIN